MNRGPIGTYKAFSSKGEACRAFIPHALPPTPALVLHPRLQAMLSRADLALGRLDGLLDVLPSAGLISYCYTCKEAVMSSGIEGTRSTLADLMLYEAKGSPGAPGSDVEKVFCCADALRHAVQLLAEGQPIGTKVLNEIHRRLMSYGKSGGQTYGEIRRVQNWVGGGSLRQATFVPPPPERVARCLLDLQRFLKAEQVSYAPLIKAALSHLQFETIHPYADGNGRLGRILVALIFLSEKVLHKPVLFLSHCFHEHRGTYYGLLQKVRENGDWEQWVEFFAAAVEAAATQGYAFALKLLEIRERDERWLFPRFGRTSSVVRIYQSFCERPMLSVAQLCRRTNLAPHTVGRALLALMDARLIREVTGKKRDRIYAYAAYVELLGS